MDRPKLVTIRPKIQQQNGMDGFIVSLIISKMSCESVQASSEVLKMFSKFQASAIRAVSMGEGHLDKALDIIHRQNDDYINRQPCVNGLASSNNTGKMFGLIFDFSVDKLVKVQDAAMDDTLASPTHPLIDVLNLQKSHRCLQQVVDNANRFQSTYDQS